MQHLDFKYLKAKNILCFGEEGVELNFKNLGPVVLLKGINKDTSGADFTASNGAGKSTIQDVISYALYGKTVKKPKQMKKDKIVHAKAEGKGLCVEILFGDYRIVRQIGPTKLSIWKSSEGIWDKDTNITRGTMAATQEYIDGILGMTHQSFCNVVVFDDSNTYSFLEADTPGKRDIVENLLGLDRYRNYHQVSKDLLKDIKLNVKTMADLYEKSQSILLECDARIAKVLNEEEAWKTKQKLEASQVMKKLELKQQELNNLDLDSKISEYQQAQERITELQSLIEKIDPQKEEIHQSAEPAKNNLQKLKDKKDEINQQIQEKTLLIKQEENNNQKSESLIEDLKNLAEGTKCPVCHGEIDSKNYKSVLEHEEHIAIEGQSKVLKLNEEVSTLLSEFKKTQVSLSKIEDLLEKAASRSSMLDKQKNTLFSEIASLSKISKPDMGAQQQVLTSEINELKRQLKEYKVKLEGESPYQEILLFEQNEKKEKEKITKNNLKMLEASEKELPYYDYWVKAFGDNGIRKFVVEGIIPALNSRIAYWMQHLYDGQIELSFDNELVETIYRNGVPAYYPALSNGEKQRVNLAVSQSFAYVMMLNFGSCPSLVFLDEITGGGIDQAGISGVFNMICELAKERQVFVTTHNEYLLNMLEGYEEIHLLKENDITKIVC